MADHSYYPSWKMKIAVRLEEFGQPGVLKPPSVPVKNLSGIQKDRAPLDAVKDPDFPGRFLLKPRVDRATLDDAIKNYVFGEASGDGLTHVISGVIPRTFEWRQNGFRTADEFRARLKWIDFPLDPRCVRSIAVMFYLGTVTPTEYALGIAGRTRGALGNSATNSLEPLNVVPDSWLDEGGARRSNLRFVGWVDKMKGSSDDEGSWVEFECTDNTRLLIAQDAPPKLVIGMEQPIDEAVATYLSHFPQFAGMTVEYRGVPGTPVPKLKGVLAGTAFRPQLGPQPSGGDDLTVWDYLTDVSGSIGHLVRVEGTSIILQRPATILHGELNPRNDDPFQGRKIEEGEFKARPFVYGKNVKFRSVSRDFSKNEARNVEVRCYSPRRKQVLVARFPSKDKRLAASTPGDARADNKWEIVRVQGIEDQEVLQQIAEDYYHGRNRRELEIVIKTKNLASFGGVNDDPDLLDAKPGDAFELLADRAPASSDAEAEKKLTVESTCAQMMTELGFSKDFASAYARCYSNAGFQRLFRLREMAVAGDEREGVALEIRAANFVQVRGDVPPKGAPVTPNASSAATQGGGKSAGGPPGTVPVTTKSQVQVNDVGGKKVAVQGSITIFKKK